MIGSVRISREKHGPADLRAPLRGWRGGTCRGWLPSWEVLGRKPGGMAGVGGEAVASCKLGGPTDSTSFWGPDLPCRPPDSNHRWACPEHRRWQRAHTGSARALGALGSVSTYAGDHPPWVAGRRAASSPSSPPSSCSSLTPLLPLPERAQHGVTCIPLVLRMDMSVLSAQSLTHSFLGALNS